MRKSSWTPILVAASCALLAACGTTRVHPQQEASHVGLARPDRILVYDLATSETEVSPNASATSRAHARASGKSEAQRSAELRKEAVNAFGDDLTGELRKLGFDAARVSRGTPVTGNEIGVTGEFIDINEGNRLKRIVIGFGSGKSAVDTQVHVRQGTRHLADFTTHSDSGSLPGAVVTVPAGAVATGGIGVATVATTAAVAGVKVHRSATAQMAGRSGEQAAAYMSEVFARQGWIRDDQVLHAKLDDKSKPHVH